MPCLGGMPGMVRLGDWFSSGTLAFPISFLLDGLGLGFGTLVAFIALVTLKFSASYMHREAGFHRFFIGMNLFVGGMLLIVLAGNAALTFVGWEFAGVSSWMLIGYAYDRTTATLNAQRAFITNRIGDAGFILGPGTRLHLARRLRLGHADSRRVAATHALQRPACPGLRRGRAGEVGTAAFLAVDRARARRSHALVGDFLRRGHGPRRRFPDGSPRTGAGRGARRDGADRLARRGHRALRLDRRLRAEST